jgi:ribonuclease HII
MKDRDETKAMVQEIQANPRHADFGVFGNGPLLVSDIPESCMEKGAEVHIGIDEAGRGSVLGPMLYGAAYWSVSNDNNDNNNNNKSNIPKGFQDSKALTEATRFRLFDELLNCPDIGFVARSLLPAEISRNMLRNETPYNLNQMSHDSAMIMIAKLLAAKVPLKKAFVDTVGNPLHYKRKLEREFPTIDFVVESKADANYATCSAASVGKFGYCYYYCYCYCYCYYYYVRLQKKYSSVSVSFFLFCECHCLLLTFLFVCLYYYYFSQSPR